MRTYQAFRYGLCAMRFTVFCNLPSPRFFNSSRDEKMGTALTGLPASAWVYSGC